MNEGLQTALNQIRESVVSDNKVYQEQIPVVSELTSSQAYGQALLSLPSDMRNKFISSLVNRISYTAFEVKYFNNPLKDLQRNELPLGAIGQNIYINPARGRVYNIDDFAGLLAKYESDIKSEYTPINFDVQYPVTIVRKELEKAFTSWGDLERFLSGITTSLYNGAYIDDYKFTKKLITNAYTQNAVQMERYTFAGSTPTADELKGLVKKLRTDYKNFQIPSVNYNAWAKVGGYGRAIVSWSDPEDIVVFVNNQLAGELDVDVLSVAFNMSKTDLIGRIYYVEDFNLTDEEGQVQVDGSNIIAFICDRRWFKIEQKDMFLDEFYNANNRSWQTYLSVIKAFNFSFFANAKMYVKAMPELNITSMAFAESSVSVAEGGTVKVKINTVPFPATQTITVASSDDRKAEASINGKEVTITGVDDGSATITATAGNVTATLSVTVTASPEPTPTPTPTPEVGQ